MGKRRTRHQQKKRELAGALPTAVARRLPWWIFLALAVAAFLPYVPTLGYKFVFDDDFQILRNPWIRNWSGLREVFTSNVWQFMNPWMPSNYYRPLHMVLYMVGYSLSGLHPAGYHLINILLHCLCTVLVALIGFRLTGNRYLSGTGALIFALHPIHAESVTWIAAVTDPSCAAFYFAAVYFYLLDAEYRDRKAPVVLVMLSWFAALLSKEMALTFPLIAVLMDWMLHRKLRWSRYFMMAGVLAVYIALRMHVLSGLTMRALPLRLDPWPHLLSTITIVARYILKLFVPHDISAFHVFSPTTSLFSRDAALAFPVLMIFGVGAWLLRGKRNAIFLIGFCVLTLLPVLNITLVGENVFADRYLYIPSLGACLLIPLVSQEVWKLRPAGLNWPGLQLGMALLAALLGIYAHVLVDSCSMWRDALTLYSETLKRSPTAMMMARNLGGYYHNQGDYDKAIYWYERAVELYDKGFIKHRPNLAVAYNGLGGAYVKKRRLDIGLDYFKKAYEITPGSDVVLDNIGTVYLAMGDAKTALDYYHRAVARNPRSERSYNNVAVVHLYQGKYDDAIAMAQKALSIFPNLGEAYIVMGKAYALKGMRDDARRAFNTAREVDPPKAALVEAELKALEGGTR